jgi:hypothetical protein
MVFLDGGHLQVVEGTLADIIDVDLEIDGVVVGIRRVVSVVIRGVIRRIRRGPRGEAVMRTLVVDTKGSGAVGVYYLVLEVLDLALVFSARSGLRRRRVSRGYQEKYGDGDDEKACVIEPFPLDVDSPVRS